MVTRGSLPSAPPAFSFDPSLVCLLELVLTSPSSRPLRRLGIRSNGTPAGGEGRRGCSARRADHRQGAVARRAGSPPGEGVRRRRGMGQEHPPAAGRRRSCCHSRMSMTKCWGCWMCPPGTLGRPGSPGRCSRSRTATRTCLQGEAGGGCGAAPRHVEAARGAGACGGGTAALMAHKTPNRAASATVPKQQQQNGLAVHGARREHTLFAICALGAAADEARCTQGGAAGGRRTEQSAGRQQGARAQAPGWGSVARTGLHCRRRGGRRAAPSQRRYA